MRNAFADELLSIAKSDDRIVLLSGDIGNRLFDNFKANYPNRFYNCGVAEANMTSMAAGMALCGLKPVTYTIASFNTFRCLEQIRVDICYHNLPVIIVGVGAGLSYANLGATHHSCEDIAMLRALPNMTVICPGDAFEVRAAFRASINWNRPVYLRIGKKNEPVIHDKTISNFEIGKGIIMRNGSDVSIISTGNMLPNAMESAVILEKHNIFAQVVSFHTVKPMDTNLLTDILKNFRLVVTLEEHGAIGGLGSSVAEWIVDNNRIDHLIKIGDQRRTDDLIRTDDSIRTDNVKLLKLSTGNKFLHQSGNQKNAHKILELSSEQIAEKILLSLLV